MDYINGEQTAKCRDIQDQLNLTSIQMEKLVIFIAVLDDEQKAFIMQQLLS